MYIMEQKYRVRDGAFRQTTVGGFQPIKVTSVEILNNGSEEVVDGRAGGKDKTNFRARKLFSPNKIITRNREIKREGTTPKRPKFIFPGICNLK